MRSSQAKGFLRIQGGVNTAKDHECSAFARHAPYFIAAQRIAGVDPDSDHVSGFNARAGERRKNFIHDDRIPEARRGSSGNNVKPSWSNHPDAKRHITRIDQMHAHAIFSF